MEALGYMHCLVDLITLFVFGFGLGLLSLSHFIISAIVTLLFFVLSKYEMLTRSGIIILSGMNPNHFYFSFLSL
jgi:hypothetical protein